MAPPAAPALDVPPGVIRALLQGEQLIDVRAAGAGADPAPGERVWLCPGGDADLKPAYRMARELSQPDEPPPDGHVRIEGWADIVASATVRLDAERVAALDSKTVLALDRLSERVGGGDVAVLALRVHRLDEPITAKAGLDDLPADPAASPSRPALSDVAFEAKLGGVAEAVPGGLRPVG